MKSKKTKGSIYVCHTYYHVYVSFLKELNKHPVIKHDIRQTKAKLLFMLIES